MKIGFFGGSFNPPTLAHLNLAKQAVEKYNLDLFYFVPVNNYYPKKDLIDIDTRCEMLDIMLKNESKIKTSKIEKNRDSKYSAYEIINLIADENKDNQLYFIMGEDNYKKMPSWDHYEDLKKYSYIVFQREDKGDFNRTNENIFYMENDKNLNISSTLIRLNQKEHKPIDNYVTKEIKEFIKNNKLYL